MTKTGGPFTGPLYYLFILHLFFLIPACTDSCPVYSVTHSGIPLPQPGIAFTFDDAYTGLWKKAHETLFIPENICVTFFVTGIQDLPEPAISTLRTFSEFGHDIEDHSLYHENAVDYVEQFSLASYVSDRLVPSIESGKNKGFDYHFFAYPFGAASRSIIDATLEYFDAVRLHCTPACTHHLKDRNEIFVRYAGQDIYYPASIDEKNGYSSEEIVSAIRKAAEENAVIVLAAHRIVPQTELDNHDWTVSYERLSMIINEAKKLNMKFYTISSLFDGTPCLPQKKH